MTKEDAKELIDLIQSLMALQIQEHSEYLSDKNIFKNKQNIKKKMLKILTKENK